MKKIFKRNNLLIILPVLITFLLVIGISYSFYLADVETINKTNTVLIAEDVELVFETTSEINYSNMIPGDKFTKNFELRNNSNVRVNYNIGFEKTINEFRELGDTDLVYSLSDDDGLIIDEALVPATNEGVDTILSNLWLNAHSQRHYSLTIEYKYRQDVDQSATQGKKLKTRITMNNKRENELVFGPYKCKRATKLHTEECTVTGGGCAAAGYSINGDKGTSTITYGQLGTAGELPQVGDAFNCDLNADGAFDEYFERFYYVNTMNNGIDQNNDVAVLLYYRNYINHIQDNEMEHIPYAAYSYIDTDGKTATSYNTDRGPVRAVRYLPTTEDWPLIRLYSTTRNITREDNSIRKSNFEYKYTVTPNDGTPDKEYETAARLITYQEFANVCGVNVSIDSSGEETIGSVDKNRCLFMYEKTLFGNPADRIYDSAVKKILVPTGYYLTETPTTFYEHGTWHFAQNISNGCYMDNNPIDGAVQKCHVYDYGVRPAIEIPFSQIQY